MTMHQAPNQRRLHRQRGAALAETAVIISFTLLLMLGALQIALLGFGQISADGAAFVASLADSTGYANPQGLGASIFPGIEQSNISMSTATGAVVGTATMGVPGLGALPGLGSITSEQGDDIEPYTTLSQDQAPQPFTFAVDANLANFCVDGAQCTSDHPMTLAQHINQSGNGINGQFTEWDCHQTAFQSLSFPSTLPTPGPTWDITNSSSPEYTIYQWDSGATCP